MKTIRTDRAREAFISTLTSTCNVSAACRAAKIGRSAAYAWRKEDEGFAASWADAEGSFYRACKPFPMSVIADEALKVNGMTREQLADPLRLFRGVGGCLERLVHFGEIGGFHPFHHIII
mgnify:CR=1 FL=1